MQDAHRQDNVAVGGAGQIWKEKRSASLFRHASQPSYTQTKIQAEFKPKYKMGFHIILCIFKVLCQITTQRRLPKTLCALPVMRWSCICTCWQWGSSTAAIAWHVVNTPERSLWLFKSREQSPAPPPSPNTDIIRLENFHRGWWETLWSHAPTANTQQVFELRNPALSVR